MKGLGVKQLSLGFFLDVRMPSIKIYPPSQLPDREVSETQFSIWCEELEVYLAQEEDFAQFLPKGKYANWQSKEVNPEQIQKLHNDDIPELNTNAARAAKLRSVRTKLRTVYGLYALSSELSWPLLAK